ncbi:unnamed protein product [Rotaria magnacalcarata]|uniref:Tetratricopeptide repeat protein n=1 Tax=Rotaria magnacalcarata TaxID=392030 RepID=A0A816AJL9_9BILA|nr:unnamed protein product [Rotaria magnacalcarata]CAF1596438.1 unnamed protein product [Rotaria magnacalcarata]CAF4048131.1 unnamed protein product [Rotaria magnacalcarata]CAF4058100.1 unnamed protein product [Rotaria magnacalcarata]
MSVNAVHDALVSFKKSISLNDRQSDVFYARGMLHYSLGRYEAAANDHQRALELSELNSTVPLIYQTLNPMYNSSEYYNNIRIVQERPLRKAEAELKQRQEKQLPVAVEYRNIAECQQQGAPYTYDPEKNHRLARGHIQQAIFQQSSICDEITLGINYAYEAHMLCSKYANSIAPEHIVAEFIDSTIARIRNMSDPLEKCGLNHSWNEFVNPLHELMSIPITPSDNIFSFFRTELLRVELNRVEMVKKTSDKFKDSAQ